MSPRYDRDEPEYEIDRDAPEDDSMNDETFEEDEGYVEPEEIYDAEGNLVWAEYYDGQFVDRTCTYCKSTFRGMPDHSVCNPCADRLERGEDMYALDDNEWKPPEPSIKVTT